MCMVIVKKNNINSMLKVVNNKQIKEWKKLKYWNEIIILMIIKW
jgi:hypothetical protein